MTLGQIAIQAAEAILPLAAAAATGLIAKGAQYAARQVSHLHSHVVQEALDWAIREAEHAASTVVVALNQTVTNVLKAQGTWNASAAETVKAQAMQTLQHVLSHEAQAILQQAIPNLAQWYSTLIEEAVARAPNKTATPKPATPAS